MTHTGGTVKTHGFGAAGEYVEVTFTDPAATVAVLRTDVTPEQWGLLIEDWDDAKPQPSTISCHIVGTPPKPTDVKRVKG